MGLKDFLRGELPAQKYNANFNDAFVRGWHLHHKMTKVPTKGLTATLHTTEGLGEYVSAKRVIAGGILFGPIGIVAGATARKNANAITVLIERDGQIIGSLEDHPKHHAKAKQFTDALNASAADPNNPGK